MPALSIMVKPASGICNMNCKYCFYRDEVSCRTEGQFGFMSEETADNLIAKTMEFACGNNIYYVFQGGEPLLCGIDFFKHFVSKVNEMEYQGKVFYSLQTNGTLIDDDWAEFFKQNNFLIGVSLDGKTDVNKFRLMSDGTPSFDKVMKAIEVLDKHDVPYNVLSVVTGYGADNIDKTYNFFKKKGFKFLQFIPAIRPIGDDSQSELYMTEKQYQNSIIKLFKLYANDFLNGNYISIRNFDNMVRLYGGGTSEQCGMNGTCTHQFVVEANGNIYPCDFYAVDEWLLGNINSSDFRTIFYSEKGVQFIKESFAVSNKCKKCEYFKYCRGGGCKREKVSLNCCTAYKNFYKKNEELFKQILSKLKVEV